ncbi:MAG: FBP domain-containing protein [Oligoflexus sp.]
MNKYSIETIKSSFSCHDIQERWSAPDVRNIYWDDLDFLTWKHPDSGHYYACLETVNGLHGVVFQMNPGNGRSAGHCDFCLASNQEIGVKAAFIEVDSNPRYKVGLHVCGDLACSARVRGKQAGYFMYETISVGRRIERLQSRLQRFWQRVTA